jgi:hypothetical protein
MPQRFAHRQVIRAATEATYGTAAALAAANALLTRRNPEFVPLEGTDDQIDSLRTFFGSQGTRLNQNFRRIRFEIDAGGAGAAGTAAPYGPLLVACGMAQTLTATVKADYSPVSSSFGSATIQWHDDTTGYTMTGARGTCSLQFEAGKRPYFRFDFLGLVGAIADGALPAATLTAFREPLALSPANTPTFSLHGYAGALERLEIALGNTLEGRALINDQSVQIVGRRASGTAVIEADNAATFEPVGRALGSTRGTLSLIHGTVAGNILEIAAPAVELGRPTPGVSNNIRNWSLPLEFCHSAAAGNDEITITIR